MDWTTILILTVIAFGYMHLLKISKNRSVIGLVKLNVESSEMDESGDLPREFATFTKGCRFIITPVPGMEFKPSGIEGAVIKRVIIDEGLIEVWCILTI